MWKKALIIPAATFSILMLSSCSLLVTGNVVESGGNNNSSGAKIQIQNVYGRTGFMDQVQAAHKGLDCVANDALEITNCIKTNGSWEVILPDVTSCDGLAITEKLGLFDWTCSDDLGRVTFASTIKDGVSLSDFLDPGAFKTNKVTITDAGGKTIVETEEATWFTDTVQVLPVSTSGTGIIMLTRAGIYTFGPSASPIMTNTIGIAVDKIAIVGLGDAELKFNAGCVDAGAVGIICTTLSVASNFNYVEGRLVSPPATDGKNNFTVAVVGTNLQDPLTYPKFVDFRNIEIIKNPAGTTWGTINEPEGLLMTGKFHRISGTLRSDGLMALDITKMVGGNHLISANITATNSYKPGIVVFTGPLNVFSGAMNISNIASQGVHLEGNGNIYSGDINITNIGGDSFYLKGSQNTFEGNINISNTVGNGMNLNGSQNVFNGDINISNIDSEAIHFMGTQDTINSNITINNTMGFHLVGATENHFNGTITINNSINAPLDIVNNSSNNTFTGTINISGAPMAWSACLDISNRDGGGGIGLSSNSNILSGALNLNNCNSGLSIMSSHNNSISGLVTVHDVYNAVYILGDAQLNSVTSVDPTSNITLSDVLIAPKGGEPSPVNNTVTSYDASIFASCGVPATLPFNTTSCP